MQAKQILKKINNFPFLKKKAVKGAAKNMFVYMYILDAEGK